MTWEGDSVTPMQLMADASAAIAVVNRKVSVKMRHVSTNELCVQDQVDRRVIQINKVPGTENLADGLTKALGKREIGRHIELIQGSIRGGGHAIMPEIDKGTESMVNVIDGRGHSWWIEGCNGKKYTTRPKKT